MANVVICSHLLDIYPFDGGDGCGDDDSEQSSAFLQLAK